MESLHILLLTLVVAHEAGHLPYRQPAPFSIEPRLPTYDPRPLAPLAYYLFELIGALFG